MALGSPNISAVMVQTLWPTIPQIPCQFPFLMLSYTSNSHGFFLKRTGHGEILPNTFAIMLQTFSPWLRSRNRVENRDLLLGAAALAP